MKNAKLRIRVKCCDRDFYLFRPKGRRDYHVWFTVPKWARAERMAQGKKPVVVRTTGTCEVAPAREIGARIIESHWQLPADGARTRDGLTSQSELATMAEIMERYNPLPQHVARETVTKVRSAMRVLLRDGANVDMESASSAVLAGDGLIKNFQRRRLEAVRASDFMDQQSAMVSINSTVRQARSMFSRDHMHLYNGLQLPDLAAFRGAVALKVKRDPSFVLFPHGTLERIEREMRGQPRNVFLASLLMLRLGLRNKEVQFAKWEWFSRWMTSEGVVGQVTIEIRPYFKVKNQSLRVLQLPGELVNELAPFWGGPDEWVMDGPNEAARYDASHRDLNVWLRTIIRDRTKCAYELRKHAGSVVLTRPESERGGLAAAARFLGDTIQTTEKHYARFLRQVHAVRAAELKSVGELIPMRGVA